MYGLRGYQAIQKIQMGIPLLKLPHPHQNIRFEGVGLVFFKEKITLQNLNFFFGINHGLLITQSGEIFDLKKTDDGDCRKKSQEDQKIQKGMLQKI